MTSHRIALLVLAATVLLAPGAGAVDEVPSCPPGTWHVWQRAEDGLDSNFVNDIAVLDDGSVALATNDLYPVETHGGGVSVRDAEGGWTVHRRASGGLQSDTVYSVLQVGDRLLAGTLKGAAEVAFKDESAWRGLPSRPVMPFRLSDVSDLASSGAAKTLRTFFATNAGLFVQAADRSWTRFGTDAEGGGLRGRFVSAVATDRDSGVWIGTSGHGVAHWDYGADRWQVWSVTEGGLCNDYVYDIAVSGPTSAWVGTGIGACEWAAGEDGTVGWVHLTSRNSPLPDDDVRAVHVDAGGRTWFGTHQGLAVREGQDNDSWGVCSPMPAPEGAASPDGAVAKGVPHRLVVTIEESPDGTLWFGTYGGGVASFTPAIP